MEFFPSLLPSTLVLLHFLLFFSCFPLFSLLFPVVFSPSHQLPSLLHHHRSAQSHLRHRSAEPRLHLPSISLCSPQTDVSRFGFFKTRSVNISSLLHHTCLTTMLYSLFAFQRNHLHLRPANTRWSVSHTRPRVDLTRGRVVHTLRSVDSCHPRVVPPLCPSPAYLHPYQCFVMEVNVKNLTGKTVNLKLENFDPVRNVTTKISYYEKTINPDAMSIDGFSDSSSDGFQFFLKTLGNGKTITLEMEESSDTMDDVVPY